MNSVKLKKWKKAVKDRKLEWNDVVTGELVDRIESMTEEESRGAYKILCYLKRFDFMIPVAQTLLSEHIGTKKRTRALISTYKV